VNTETEGKIVRIIDKGVIVELPDGVDGFVPVSQLSFAPVRNIAEFFHIDDTLKLNVVEFDKESKKIVLSAVEYLRGKDQAEIDAYNAAHPVPNSDNKPHDPNKGNTEDNSENEAADTTPSETTQTEDSVSNEDAAPSVGSDEADNETSVGTDEGKDA